MRVLLSSSIIVTAGIFFAAKFDTESISNRLRGPDEGDIHLELELQKWRSRVGKDRKLTEAVATMKASFAARTGRELQDRGIFRAMQSAKARAPKRFSVEWAEQFKDMNPPLGFDGHVPDPWNQRGLGRRRRAQTIEQVDVIAISALSPLFAWNTHLWTNESFAGDAIPPLYCAGVTLEDPLLNPIRPNLKQDMVVLNCLENFARNRTRSQIVFEYSNYGELKFFEISNRDPYSDPFGWCVSLKRVKKNRELIADYCDDEKIEQVWRLLVFDQDNTWRPEAEWYGIDGVSDGGLCVETKNSTLSDGVGIHLRPCTYKDQEARQRQTWIWCFEATACETGLSEPPDYTLEVNCDETSIEDTECGASKSNRNTEDGGAVPVGTWEELNECDDDPVGDKRFGNSLVYKVTDNGDDEYLVLNLDSSCDNDADDADTYLRVYEEQSGGEYDCVFVSNTDCQDEFDKISAVVEPHNDNILVIVSNDGTDRTEVDFNLDMDCTTDEYTQIRLTGDNDDLCFGVENTNTNTEIRLYECSDPPDDNANLLLWMLDDDRRLVLKADSNKCVKTEETSGNIEDGTPIVLANCDDGNDQKWRYDQDGDNEIKSVENSDFCLTYDVDENNPDVNDEIQLQECDGESRQEWQFELFSNPSLSPDSVPEEYLYCGDEVTRNTANENDEEDSTVDYDENACQGPNDVFDDDDNLRESFEFVDAAGISLDIVITSLCNGDAGEGDNESQKTLYRLYEVVDNDQYECRQWRETTCDDSNSNDPESVTFSGLNELRYLVRVTNALIDIETCTVNDDCTRERIFDYDDEEDEDEDI